MGEKRAIGGAKGKKELLNDPDEYKILKEGEAEILMHGNDVFYNKTQVVNRDLSIAVLRTLVHKLQEEQSVKRKRKGAGQAIIAASKADIGAEPSESCNEDNGKHEGQTSDLPKDTDSEAHTSNTVNNGEKDAKPLRVLEALAASGLRALRYAREVEGVGSVIAVDNDKVAFEACKRNIKLNGSVACSKVEPQLADCRVYMLTHPKEFDVVDLDPYGSPSIFLDSAIQSVVDGGMIMCTATDMAVLCGNNGEVCYSKYGAYPSRGKYCHEMALRILLSCIESHANRYKRYIVPMLSVSVDFYVRVFVRIYTSASEIKKSPLKLSYVYQCVGCDSFHLQPLARIVSKGGKKHDGGAESSLEGGGSQKEMNGAGGSHQQQERYAPAFGPVVPQACGDCGKRFNMAGPIWSAPIHDQDFVASTLANVTDARHSYPAYERISALLTTISEELPDVPLYLSLHNLCATLKCTSPSAVMFRSAVLNASNEYRISGTHANPLGLKTNAPMGVIWDIMRCWVKLHPVKAQQADQSGSVILSKEPIIQANFARAKASLSKAQAKKIARFLPNPENHWGPKPRAGRQITKKHVSLLGPDKINGYINHEEAEEQDSKRLKVS